MRRRAFLGMLGCSVAGLAFGGAAAGRKLPNIVYVLADDMGWGDVSCNNPKGKIPTPNIDRLAAEGIRFTAAYAGSAACTPTRYGLMTGQYCWRTRLKRGVGWCFDPPLIARDRLTVPELLKAHGYDTAMFGKWHLGLGFPTTDGKAPSHRERPANIAWGQPLTDSPLDHGFDVFFGTAASLDMPPYGWIEGRRFVAPCTEQGTLHKIVGPMQKGFRAEEALPTITRKTVEYLRGRKGASRPCFVYMALTAPHEPLAPSKAFQGKSPLGRYGDFCMEVDAAVGQVCEALREAGLEGETWVLFSADNGCSRLIGVEGMAKKGHLVSGGFRGYKAEIYEGGDRVPYVMRWPGVIRPGQVSDERVSLTDLMATCAELVGAELPRDAGEDSISNLPLLEGASYAKPLRPVIIHQANNGALGITKGKWKLELCKGNGGWFKPYDGKDPKTLPSIQLYDIEADPAETVNVQDKHPDVVRELRALLRRYETSGRTRP